MFSFLLDQNVPVPVLALLTSRYPSISFEHVSATSLKGSNDKDIFNWAQANTACVVTFDSDFADRRFFQIDGRCGVLWIRINPANIQITYDALCRVLDAFGVEDLFGALTIVDRNKIRHIPMEKS